MIPNRRVLVLASMAFVLTVSSLLAQTRLGDFTQLAEIRVDLGSDFQTKYSDVTGFCQGGGYIWAITGLGYVVKIDENGSVLDVFKAADVIQCYGAIAYDDESLWIYSVVDERDELGNLCNKLSHFDLAGSLLGGIGLRSLGSEFSGEITGLVKDENGFWLFDPWMPNLFQIDGAGRLLKQYPNAWYGFPSGCIALVGDRLVKLADAASPSGAFMDRSAIAIDRRTGAVTDIWNYPFQSPTPLGFSSGGDCLWLIQYDYSGTALTMRRLALPAPAPTPEIPSRTWGDFQIVDWGYCPVRPSMIEGLYGFEYDRQNSRLLIGDGIAAHIQAQDVGTRSFPVIGSWSGWPDFMVSYDLVAVNGSVWVAQYWRAFTQPRLCEISFGDDGNVHISRQFTVGMGQVDGLASDGIYFWVSGRTTAESTGDRSNEIKKFDFQGNEIAHFQYPDDDEHNFEDLTWHQGRVWGITRPEMSPGPAVIHVIDPSNGAELRRLSTGWNRVTDNAQATLASDGQFLWTISTTAPDDNPFESYEADHLRILKLSVPGEHAYFPLLSQGNGESTAFAISNFTDLPAQLQFSALDANGGLLAFPRNPSIQDLAPRRQVALFAHELFGGDATQSRLGWVDLSSSAPVAGFFQVLGENRMDGGIAFRGVHRRLHLTRVFEGAGGFRGQGASTLLSIANPGSSAVSFRLRLLGLDGKPIKPDRSMSLDPRASLCRTVADIFGLSSLSSAYVDIIVDSGEGVVAFELVRLPGRKTVIGLNGVPESDFTRAYSAQLACTNDIFTSLKLINTSAAPRSVTLTAIRDDGSPLAPAVFRQLAAGAALEADVDEIFSFPVGDVVGSLRIEANGAGVVGDVVFGEALTARYSAALPLQTEPFRKAVFSQVANCRELFTGLALHNPGTEPADVMIRVYSWEGALTGEKMKSLAPGARVSQLLHELVPETAGQVRGYVLIESTRPIIAQQLFAPWDMTWLTAVPAVVLR